CLPGRLVSLCQRSNQMCFSHKAQRRKHGHEQPALATIAIYRIWVEKTQQRHPEPTAEPASNADRAVPKATSACVKGQERQLRPEDISLVPGTNTSSIVLWIRQSTMFSILIYRNIIGDAFLPS